MLNTEKVVAKAEKWLETAEDPMDIEDVQMYLGRIANNPDSPRVKTWVRAVHDIVKGTRLTVTLNQAQKADVVEAANMLHAIFIAYPDLTVPRTRTIEKISERLTEAKIASIKAGSQ
jgi:hypothetical protein